MNVKTKASYSFLRDVMREEKMKTLETILVGLFLVFLAQSAAGTEYNNHASDSRSSDHHTGDSCCGDQNAADSDSGDAAVDAGPTWPPEDPDPNAIVIAPNGNDINPCNVSSPCESLERARQAARNATNRKIYLRAGTYSRSSSLELDESDDGETWMTYPEDPVDSAVLDGGGITDGLIVTQGTSDLSIIGLTLQNVRAAAFMGSWSGGTPNLTIKWCDIGNNHDNNSAFDFGGWTPLIALSGRDIKFLNNYVHDTQTMAIGAYAYEVDDTVDGLEISGNVVLRAAQSKADSGAIYINMHSTNTNGGHVTIANNFIRDQGGPSQVEGIYLDDRSSNCTITGNIIGPPRVGAVTDATRANVSAIYSNSVSYKNSSYAASTGWNTITGNIIDLGDSARVSVGMLWGTDNVFTNNIVVSNFSGNQQTESQDCGIGYSYSGDSHHGSACTIENNLYYNYGSGDVQPTSCHIAEDGNPTIDDPGLSGDTYQIAADSPAFAAPVNFPGIVGGWGPPGFRISASTNHSQP
jgi:hypothetical protein